MRAARSIAKSYGASPPIAVTETSGARLKSSPSPAAAGKCSNPREIGSGGMATVYLAQDLRHDRKVAVKVLWPELAAVVGAERFLSEIKTTANLQHPLIGSPRKGE